MIQVAYTSIQSKIKINGLLSDCFTIIQGFRQGCPLSVLLCIIAAEILAIFIDVDTRIKDVQIGDHEIKIVSFADSTTIFLRDFSCLTQIKLILELCEKASSSKINFSKSQILWTGAYKNGIDKPRQIAWPQFSIKIVGVNVDNSVHDIWNWDKIYDHLTEKISGTERGSL